MVTQGPELTLVSPRRMPAYTRSPSVALAPCATRTHVRVARLLVHEAVRAAVARGGHAHPTAGESDEVDQSLSHLRRGLQPDAVEGLDGVEALGEGLARPPGRRVEAREIEVPDAGRHPGVVHLEDGRPRGREPPAKRPRVDAVVGRTASSGATASPTGGAAGRR